MFSFNPALCKSFSLTDRSIMVKENSQAFLEKIARARANKDMQRLYELNAPRDGKVSFISRAISSLKP